MNDYNKLKNRIMGFIICDAIGVSLKFKNSKAQVFKGVMSF